MGREVHLHFYGVQSQHGIIDSVPHPRYYHKQDIKAAKMEKKARWCKFRINELERRGTLKLRSHLNGYESFLLSS